MKILLLEDTIEIAEILKKLLTDHGHTVCHVENGAAGLESITQDDFDVVISDLNMPKMDGLTFAVTARKEGLKAPIMLFTGEPYVDPLKVQEGGITAVFDKFSGHDLVKAVNAMGNVL